MFSTNSGERGKAAMGHGVFPQRDPLGLHVLVDVGNHEHLCRVYGEAFGQRAVDSLQRHVRFLGGQVVAVGASRFLVALAKGRAHACQLSQWQFELAATQLTQDTVRALPVVAVSLVDLRGDIEAILAAPSAPEALDAAGCAAYERDMAVALALHRAMVQGRTSLVFQPIVHRSARDTVLYHEALLRVSACEGEMTLGPAMAIPALERLGLVRALDRAVLDAILGRLEAVPEVRLGCNLSAQSLVSDAWWTGLTERLAAQPNVATRLTLEITETAALADGAIAFVQVLRRLGCRIALDDFGVCQRRLAFARAVQAQVIKVDRSFVFEARGSRAGAEVLRLHAELCRTLAPIVVAEGIERPGDVQAVARVGIEWLQGHGAGAAVVEQPDVRFPAGVSQAQI